MANVFPNIANLDSTLADAQKARTKGEHINLKEFTYSGAAQNGARYLVEPFDTANESEAVYFWGHLYDARQRSVMCVTFNARERWAALQAMRDVFNYLAQQ